MRSSNAAFALVAALTSACTLFVSTSGLSGGADGGASANTLVDGGSSGGVTDASEPGPGPDTGDGASGESSDPHLLGYWKFDETSGMTASDSSGHDHPLTLTGATFDPGGKYGGAVVLPGVDGAFVSTTALSAPNFPSTGTFSVWFLWTRMQSADQSSVLSSWDTSISHIFFRHANGDTVGLFQVALEPKTLEYVWESDFPVSQNSWTHVVVTWEESTKIAATYVNGTLQSRASYTSDFAPTDQTFQLGNHLDGKIDEVRLYDRPLTEAEAVALP
jgi:hypothetical protein